MEDHSQVVRFASGDFVWKKLEEEDKEQDKHEEKSPNLRTLGDQSPPPPQPPHPLPPQPLLPPQPDDPQPADPQPPAVTKGRWRAPYSGSNPVVANAVVPQSATVSAASDGSMA